MTVITSLSEGVAADGIRFTLALPVQCVLGLSGYVPVKAHKKMPVASVRLLPCQSAILLNLGKTERQRDHPSGRVSIHPRASPRSCARQLRGSVQSIQYALYIPTQTNPARSPNLSESGRRTLSLGFCAQKKQSTAWGLTLLGLFLQIPP